MPIYVRIGMNFLYRGAGDQLLGFSYIRNQLHKQSVKQGKLFDQEEDALVSKLPFLESSAVTDPLPDLAGAHPGLCQDLPARVVSRRACRARPLQVQDLQLILLPRSGSWRPPGRSARRPASSGLVCGLSLDCLGGCGHGQGVLDQGPELHRTAPPPGRDALLAPAIREWVLAGHLPTGPCRLPSLAFAPRWHLRSD